MFDETYKLRSEWEKNIRVIMNTIYRIRLKSKLSTLIYFRLTHPTEKDTARQKFKEYVNRLATMKQVKIRAITDQSM
jgi:hypothetical protein